MARDTRRAFQKATDAMVPSVRKAFLQAIADVRSGARLSLIVEAIERGRVDEVFQLLNMDDSLFAALDESIRTVFLSGMEYQRTVLPKKSYPTGVGPLVVRFQGRHPRAERWVETKAGDLIREITEDQRQLVTEAVRRGLERGQGPRTTALDLIGRPSATGRRKGGLIGLTSGQAGWVQNMRDDLENLSADYFTRKKRDKRFDGTVRRAIKEGKPLSSADVARITGRYSDRLLRMRGDMIARTETIAAMNAGRLEAVQQMVDSGRITEEAVSLTWDATGDARTRPAHMSMEGQKRGLNGAFISPTGALLRHPGDTSMGAQGHDVIGCRCYMAVKINWLAMAV